jgi:hypothetical protein
MAGDVTYVVAPDPFAIFEHFVCVHVYRCPQAVPGELAGLHRGACMWSPDEEIPWARNSLALGQRPPVATVYSLKYTCVV